MYGRVIFLIFRTPSVMRVSAIFRSVVSFWNIFNHRHAWYYSNVCNRLKWKTLTSFQTYESRTDDHQNGHKSSQHGNSHFHIHVIERLRNLTLFNKLWRWLFWKTNITNEYKSGPLALGKRFLSLNLSRFALSSCRYSGLKVRQVNNYFLDINGWKIIFQIQIIQEYIFFHRCFNFKL